MESIQKYLAERRQFIRYKENIKCTLLCDEKSYQGEIGNISLGGVYLKAVTPNIDESHLYQLCKVMLTLSGSFLVLGATISFIGSEGNAHLGGVGLAFDLKEGKAMTVIEQYVLDKPSTR